MKIRIPKSEISDLQTIRELGRATLQSVAAHLAELQKPPLRPEVLQRHVREALGEKSHATAALVRQMLGLNQLIWQRDAKVDDVLAGFREALSASPTPGWTAEEIKSWIEIEPELAKLFQSHAVRIVSKTTDLAYDYPSLLQSSRIITDVRPIFNDMNDENLAIEGAVVSFTLRIHYDDRQGDHSLSVAVDEGDILALKEQCERAISKARLAKTQISQGIKTPTIVSGSSENEAL